MHYPSKKASYSISTVCDCNGPTGETFHPEIQANNCTAPSELNQSIGQPNWWRDGVVVLNSIQKVQRKLHMLCCTSTLYIIIHLYLFSRTCRVVHLGNSGCSLCLIHQMPQN